MAKCTDCNKNEAVSQEGWCRPCLRARLRDKFGPAPMYSHSMNMRTSAHKQAFEGDPDPSQENAIRAMEDA